MQVAPATGSRAVIAADTLPHVRVRDRDGGDLANAWKSVDEVLDFLRGDLLAAAVDHVLVPALDDQVAVRGLAADITAAVPAVRGERPRVLLRCPVVAPRGIRAPGEQRTRLARWQIPVLLVDEPHLVGGCQRTALRAADHLVGVIEGVGV